MQVIGINPFIRAAGVVAERSTRQAVSEWAERVVSRHIRRTPSLHVRLTTEKAVVAAANSDGLSQEVVDRIVASFRSGEEVFSPDRDSMRRFIAHALDTMDFVESLPSSDRRIRRIERMSWADAEQMSVEWHASIAKLRSMSKDLMDGVRKIAQFEDGSFVGELTTAKALKVEGAEMGHCVGGYWKRVAEGGTRIVSLRDAGGHPHVTVELSRSVEVEVAGRGKLRVMAEISPGMNLIVEAAEWFAAQIRGKQNRAPAEKYSRKVQEWLLETGIPSREEDFRTDVSSVGFPLFAVKTGRVFFLTESANEAFSVAAPLALARLGDVNITPSRLLRETRLHEIVSRVTDKDAVSRFAREAMPRLQEGIRRKHDETGGNILRVMQEQGVEEFVRKCFGGFALGFDPHRELDEYLVSTERKGATASEDYIITRIPNGSALKATIHTVPTVGLAMINAGRLAGGEGKILDAMEPRLREVLSAIRANPATYHVMRPSAKGVRSKDVLQAMFACGLGVEYGDAVERTSHLVRSTVKSMVMEAKKARLAGVNVNMTTNLLADGYEARITDVMRKQFGADILLFGPEPPAPRNASTPPSKPLSTSIPRR